MKTLPELDGLNEHQLRRLLVEHLTKQKLGLYWESNAIERDAAINANLVFPRLVPANSHGLETTQTHGNLIIEGDNFDSLRLLRATHRGKIRVIYIDPPYNTGNKDWVYNDSFVGANDRYRHSQWLEFIYRRLMLARDLLSNDGVIMVSINDENRARLELLMDEVFPGRRIGSFVWRSRLGGNDTSGAFFSDNHEHILVYGNKGFRFSGDEKSYSIYKHEEEGRIFYLSDLTKAHDHKERPNTYYPINDPATDIWYPCNPGRVWAYASKFRVKSDQKLRGDTIEELIEQGQVWFPKEQRVELFADMDALLAAIDSKDIPFSGNTPLLTRETPDLAEWVGRRIGYGRPRLKKFKDGLKNENSPISSWLTPRPEANTASSALNMPVVGATDEGSRILKEIMGEKAFPYPKPLSLIKALLAQASNGKDIVLDFCAGSGTTAHAVLDLNAEDNGERRFILCSSTEATAKEPAKNLCRDVCAERVRRVMTGYGDKPGLSGSFAYLQLDLIEPADVPFDATTDHALQLLSLRHQQAALAGPAGKLSLIANDGQVAVVLATSVDDESIAQLLSLPTRRLVVYSDRPQTISQCFADAGREISSYSLEDALMRGQATQQGASV